MKSSDIIIRRCFLCILDPRRSFAGYNEVIPDADDEISKYITKLILHNRGSMRSKPATYQENSYLMQILPESEESFESFVNIICDEMYALMEENDSLLPGCGVFVWVWMEEQNVIAFFKLDYQSRLMNDVESDGKISWKLNQSLLPGSSQKGYEFFMVNMDKQRVLVSDKVHKVNHEESVNFMAEYILKVSLDHSEKEMLDTIDDVVLDTISQCYREDFQQKVFEYHNAMAEKVEEDGKLHMGEIADQIFSDNETASEVCRERLAQNKIPQIPVIVSRKTEQQLKKKYKIVTSAGIEVIVPPELLDNENFFVYSRDSAGHIMITVKDNFGAEEISLEQEITEE